MQIKISDCTPYGLMATPSSLTTTQLSYTYGIQTFTLLSKNAPEAECGTFTYQIDTNPVPDYITFTSNQIIHTPTLQDPVGTLMFTIRETNNSVPLFQRLTIAITTLPCKIYQMLETSKNELFIPFTMIIGGPALPVTFPVFG